MTDGHKTGDEIATKGADLEGTGALQPTYAERLAQFAQQFESLPIFSTAAAIVTFSGTVYNV